MLNAAAQYLNLPFKAAIEFFRGKANIPTETWDELTGEMHKRAFTVAGAAQLDLLADLREAIGKAIEEGTTLAEFRADFDAIVARYGWSYKGTRGWRTAVIYDTNLSVAYSAGRFKQMSTPAVAAVRPYLRYMPSSSEHQRREHKQWYNLVLPIDDPFWDAHYPPNGWGCKCGVTSVSARGLERLQKEEAERGLPIRTEAPPVKMVEYVNRRTGQVTMIPQGIDPGWDYHPGREPWPEGVK